MYINININIYIASQYMVKHMHVCVRVCVHVQHMCCALVYVVSNLVFTGVLTLGLLFKFMVGLCFA